MIHVVKCLRKGNQNASSMTTFFNRFFFNRCAIFQSIIKGNIVCLTLFRNNTVAMHCLKWRNSNIWQYVEQPQQCNCNHQKVIPTTILLAMQLGSWNGPQNEILLVLSFLLNVTWKGLDTNWNNNILTLKLESMKLTRLFH